MESLAFSIVARIDDVLYVDDSNKNLDQLSSSPTVNVISQKRLSIPYSSAPVSSTTPYATAYSTPSFSPAPLVSPAKAGVLNSIKPHHRGFGVKKVLTDYLGVETKSKSAGNTGNMSGSLPGTIPPSQTDVN